MNPLKPLAGLKVLEFDAIGPVPFCAMMLADHGAEITRVTRPGGQPNGVDAGQDDLLLRGRSAIVQLDLKSDEGRSEALEQVAGTDVLLEGHRPGVMERLGLGPETCRKINPALVYCRITGYGQTGPLADHPGHDINYVALTGALHAAGHADREPAPILPLVGDFAGGGLLGAFGVLAAIFSAKTTGQGSVVDTSMVDGTALLMALHYGWQNAGLWSPARQSNLLDGAAPFYRCYRTAGGRHIAVGAIEPKFYLAMCKALDLNDPLFQNQMDKKNWPQMSQLVEARVASMSNAQLDQALAMPDACISWVETTADAHLGEHIGARGTITKEDGRFSVAPAPRFSRTGDCSEDT
ncbi:CaiB/BaiF CoA-transferase family protein [Roseibium sp. SCPC15]|uniref:CaiB/BaiF CoA transferase family protein n=1 Tax=Roseibium sp. SCP15 TaxID=3141376 RepID=UPI00333D67E6